jgi:hypothetical protein
MQSHLILYTKEVGNPKMTQLVLFHAPTFQDMFNSSESTSILKNPCTNRAYGYGLAEDLLLEYF